MSDGVNFARALLGQGLGLGWGDELEALIRSKLTDEEYEDALDVIRQEYGQYSNEHPLLSLSAEFAGSMAPGIAAMAIPGGQAAGVAQATGALGKLRHALGVGKTALERSVGQNVARGTTAGGLSGAIAGAGAAEEDRSAGAMAGTAIGSVLGGALPAAGAATRAVSRWAKERVIPSVSTLDLGATKRLDEALRMADIEPRDLPGLMAEDAALGVPGALMNVSPETVSQAEMLAQRYGPSASVLSREVESQRAGARGRVYENIDKALEPGNYYGDEQKFISEMRRNAQGAYDEAYAVGEVNDPEIMEILSTPEFMSFYKKAQDISRLEAQAAKLRGEDPSKYELRQIYKQSEGADPELLQALRDMGISEETIQRSATSLPASGEVVTVPDVRTLDYIKRGIDATIDAGYRGQGMSRAEANALRELRKELVERIDAAAPQYREARKTYAGDIEVLDALRAGKDEFSKMDHEQVAALVKEMGPSEMDAFRTGVARSLYSSIMNPSQNADFAKRIVNSPETMQKLKPLFKSDAQAELFEAALKRESEIYAQASKIMTGSPTSRREQMRGAFEEDPVSLAAGDFLRGGFEGSLLGMVSGWLKGRSVTDEVATRMAKMLTSKDPADIASVVEALEAYRAGAAPVATRNSTVEGALSTGLTGSMWEAPEVIEEEGP